MRTLPRIPREEEQTRAERIKVTHHKEHVIVILDIEENVRICPWVLEPQHGGTFPQSAARLTRMMFHTHSTDRQLRRQHKLVTYSAGALLYFRVPAYDVTGHVDQ